MLEQDGLVGGAVGGPVGRFGFGDAAVAGPAGGIFFGPSGLRLGPRPRRNGVRKYGCLLGHDFHFVAQFDLGQVNDGEKLVVLGAIVLDAGLDGLDPKLGRIVVLVLVVVFGYRSQCLDKEGHVVTEDVDFDL